MRRTLFVIMLCMVPYNFNFTLHRTIAEKEIIETEHLERVMVSCYTAPKSAKCADGTPVSEGIVSSNKQHLGKICIVYDENFNAIESYECHDVGGHPMLMNGTAIDIFRDDYDRCVDYVKTHPKYVYVKWIDAEE